MKNKGKMLNIIITITIWLLIFIIKWQYDVGNINITLKYATMMGVFVNLFCIITMIIIEKKITSPYIMFQILSIPFLYGNLISTELLNISNYGNMSDLKFLVTNNSLLESCFLIQYCQLALHIGNLIYKVLKRENNIEEVKIQDDIEIITMKKVAITLIIISIVPTLYKFVTNFKLSAELGYHGIMDNKNYGINAIGEKLIPFFQISLLMLMVAYKENIIKSRIVLIFTIMFYGIQMFFGNRGIPLIAVITAIWLYHIAVKKIDKKVIIILLIMIIPISSIMNVIRSVRGNSGFKEWINNAGNLMKESVMESNPIIEVFFEMGTAIYPTAYTIDVIPNKQPYMYGKVYLLSLLSIVKVNTTKVNNGFGYDINVAAQMSELSGVPFGGSYIQEVYANFGWLSPIFMIFLGMGFELLNRKIRSNNKMIEIVLIAYFLNALLWTIRNVLITIPRELFWYMLPVYILYKLMYNGYKKIEGEKENEIKTKSNRDYVNI